jgi:molybdate transport system substrate-binding protein
VFVARANPKGIERIQDLNRTDLRFLIAAESTPLGQATRGLIENLEHDAAFGPDFYDLFYTNLVARAVNGTGVIQRVLTDEADVGFVYGSEAEPASEKITVLELPEGLDVPADFVVAVLDGGQAPATARTFIEYLASPQAQTLWQDYGFVPP